MKSPHILYAYLAISPYGSKYKIHPAPVARSNVLFKIFWQILRLLKWHNR